MSKEKTLTIDSCFCIGACITGVSLIYVILQYKKFKEVTSNKSQIIIPFSCEDPIDSNILLGFEEIRNLENMCQTKLNKYIENNIMLEKLEEKEELNPESEAVSEEESEPDPSSDSGEKSILFDVDLITMRKISDELWFKNPDTKKESPLTTDTEEEWCIIEDKN